MTETMQCVTELDELFFITLYGFKAYWVIGKIDTKTANRVKTSTGINVKDYEIGLRSNELVHFYNSHYGSQEIRNGHRGITIDDIRKIPFVVNMPTYIEAGNRPNSLLFERKNPSGRFQLVVEVDNRRKKLLGKSFRIMT